MQKKTTRILLFGTAVLLLLLTAAGTASAVSFEIDFPQYASPGDTVTGYVWIKDAGDTDKAVTSYQAALIADPALNPYIDYTLPYLKLGGPNSHYPQFIAESYVGTTSYAINPSSEKLCAIKITIPNDAPLGSEYSIGFNSTPGRTFLITYAKYFDNGITGHWSSHGALTPSALTRVSDSIKVVSSGTYSTVTFYKETGEVHNATTVLDGLSVSAPEDPVKEGYTFNDWRIGSSSGSAYDFSTPVIADIDLYANWTVNTYTIACTQPSHGTADADTSSDFGSTVTVTVTPADGYQFDKLVVTRNDTGADIPASGNTFVMPASDVTVSAQVKVIPTPIPTSIPTPTPTSAVSSGSSQLIGSTAWITETPTPVPAIDTAAVTETPVPTVAEIPTVSPVKTPTSAQATPGFGAAAGIFGLLFGAGILLRYQNRKNRR